jgi:2-C-methyl-D-erythritol 4-phosphate cytidylyltransferase
MKAAAIIVAAGASRRFNAHVPKQFIRLKGLPVFLWSVRAFRMIREFKTIIVVVPEQYIASLAKYRKKYAIEFVAGGKERFDSVKAGLDRVPADNDYIAIHDGARPLITADLIRCGLTAAQRHGASVIAVPSRDTVKVSSRSLWVSKTVPRSDVWLAQTPQIFRRSLIVQAYKALRDTDITDDAQIIERMGHPVKIVPGDYNNIKITQYDDLELAKMLLLRKNK